MTFVGDGVPDFLKGKIHVKFARNNVYIQVYVTIKSIYLINIDYLIICIDYLISERSIVAITDVCST